MKFFVLFLTVFIGSAHAQTFEITKIWLFKGSVQLQLEDQFQTGHLVNLLHKGTKIHQVEVYSYGVMAPLDRDAVFVILKDALAGDNHPHVVLNAKLDDEIGITVDVRKRLKENENKSAGVFNTRIRSWLVGLLDARGARGCEWLLTQE